MSDRLIERLNGHIAELAADRADCVDDVGVFPAPVPLEGTLAEAVKELDNARGLADEVHRLNRLLHQAVEELNRYREWATQVRYVAGSGPAGPL